jgi:hypothetical protein
MSRFHSLALLVLVGVTLQPLAGLDCSPRGSERLPCCDEPQAGCHQVAAAAACCQDAPSSSDSGSVVAASPNARPHDALAPMAAQPAVVAPLVRAAGFAELARSTVESPPRAPAVLRL